MHGKGALFALMQHVDAIRDAGFGVIGEAMVPFVETGATPEVGRELELLAEEEIAGAWLRRRRLANMAGRRARRGETQKKSALHGAAV
jgi:hypothetical protein